MDVFPNYYDKFKCIADRCKHSCCIGWEIDIDDDTMELYASIGDENILKNIEGEPPHFKLKGDERCPFLNEKGLCDIITKYGDGAICDICYFHPRFRNFYENSEETGLGLCCEEAARIVLSETEKFSIPVPDDATEEEKAFFTERQSVFDILQNRTLTIYERFDILCQKYGVSIDFDREKIYNTLMGLERLDEKWTEEIEKFKKFSFDKSVFENKEHSTYFEQLACYFIFRHFTMDCDFSMAVWFAVFGCFVVGSLWSLEKCDFEKICDIARMYSSEIEYSEENLTILKG